MQSLSQNKPGYLFYLLLLVLFTTLLILLAQIHPGAHLLADEIIPVY